MIRPTLGWYLSQANEDTKINRGIAIMRAAKNTIKLKAPDIRLPNKGIYPRIVVIGEKNTQIDTTINMKHANLIKLLKQFIFADSYDIIYSAFDFFCSIKLIYLRGENSCAVQFERKQQQPPSSSSSSGLPFYWMSILKGVNVFFWD